MATALSQAPRKQRQILTNAQRDAIIAACGAGAHKGNLAKELGIRPETVSRVIRDAKSVQTASNPLASDYKASMKERAVRAINRGLESKRDPYKAANIGVRVLEGIGEFASPDNGPGQTQITINFAWGVVSEPEYAGALEAESTPVSD